MIYYIRHGFSCANLFHNKKLKISKITSQIKKQKDTPLSNLGIRQSKMLRQKINVDFVFCSPLLRAIQTAFYIFPYKHIIICPYLIEKQNEFGDKLMKHEKKLKILKSNYYNVDYTFLKHKDINKSSLKMFEKFIGNLAKQYNIGVVTHGMLLKSHFKYSKFYNNNCIIKQSGQKIFNGFSNKNHCFKDDDIKSCI